MTRPHRPIALLSLALATAGCSPTGAPTRAPPSSAAAAGSEPSSPRLAESLARAVEWAATLDVHPVRVRRELGMKGVKHFVEYLDLLFLARRQRGSADLAAAAQRHAEAALRAIEKPDYHDLALADERRFREDSMSYLRACWLAEQFGVGTTRYRAEIEKVLPRIYAHLPGRGVDQQMGFAVLFRQLGFAAPQSLGAVYAQSNVARHQPLSYFLVSGDRPYDLTHEIFAITERGAAAFRVPLREDEDYARETVRSLLELSLDEGNLDLTGELLVNLCELGESRSQLAVRAIDTIYGAQNRDGSFGIYDPEQAKVLKGNPRYDARIGGNLHTTMVCCWGLFEGERSGS